VQGIDSITLLWLLPLFFVAAFVYSSVGHGGGSAYLAIMALTPTFASGTIRSTALALNIVVATAGFISYHRARHFQVRLLLPFALFSIPAAYVGGLRLLSPRAFALTLGVTLLVSALRLVFLNRPIEPRAHLSNRQLWIAGPFIGAGLGMLAGMVGVGGGIFLSPVLLFLGWADAKKTAAVSAAFIVVNSISGLVAQTTKTALDWVLIAPLAVTVLVAGVIGSRLGANRFAPVWLQRLLAAVLAVAAYHLLKRAFL
jgi:uncharacterized membrane protein YfcA